MSRITGLVTAVIRRLRLLRVSLRSRRPRRCEGLPDPATNERFARWVASLQPWAPSRGQPRRQQRRRLGAGSDAGGRAVLGRYGGAFFGAIGSRGGQTVVHERGVEYLQEIGAKGGRATSQRYGREHYAVIGRKGAQAGRGRKRREGVPSP